jgi:glycosyltransferase involved in cell wall biosynthesis
VPSDASETTRVAPEHGGPRARTRVGLVIPALDEEQALPLVLGELPRALFARVVVVDNGSRDQSAAVARACGAEVVCEPRRGYGAACLAGIAALGADVDVVAFVDADHSDHPSDLARVLEPVLAGRAELAIGSRILGGASRDALLPQAWYGNRLACWLMRVLFGARWTDLGPMRAIERRALERLELGDRGFGWTVEMQLKAHAAGLVAAEVPVSYRARVGRSKITGTVAGTLRAGAKILGWIAIFRIKTLAAGRRRRARPTAADRSPRSR